MKFFTTAPFAHVVVPGIPAPLSNAGPVRLPCNDVGAFEQGDQHFENDQHVLALLVGHVRRYVGGTQLQIRIGQYNLQEIVVGVLEQLVRFFIFVVTLATVILLSASR